MTVYVPVEPDPEGLAILVDRDPSADPSVNLATPELTPQRWLRAAYNQRLESYDRGLAAAWGIQAQEDPAAQSSRYPELVVKLDGDELVVFDDTLYQQLFDIYVVYGWSGILQVENALMKVARENIGASGGTVISIWEPARSFFVFTRNVLSLLVRDALLEVERRSASQLIVNLGRSAATIARAWTAEFRITRASTEITVINDDGFETKVPRVTYAFGNRELADQLFKALLDAVLQRVAFEQLLTRIAGTREELRRTRLKIRRAERRRQPEKARKEKEKLSRLELKERDLEDLRTRTTGFYTSMLEILHMNAPLGLLAVDGLTPSSTVADMERLLGQALWELYDHLDELGRGIDPQRSWIASRLPGINFDGPVDWHAVQRLPATALSLEETLAEHAIESLPRDLSCFALLHGPTLQGLVEAGQIPRDSLAFIVWFHHVSAVDARLEVRREQEEASQAFWQAFSRAAAAASIATLVTPATAALAPTLRVASALADLLVLAHAVVSVTEQLSRLDQLLAEQLLHPDAFALQQLARLGELGAFKRTLIMSLSEQVILEIAFRVSGANWPVVRKLLAARGFLLDVQTLLGNG